MKYYSEKLDRMFDSAKELKAAEAALLETVQENTPAEEIAEQQTPTRKQLAADVENAEAALKQAYSEYELAKKKAEERSKEYLAEIDAILAPAKKSVKDAEQARYNAISKFNAAYGPYQVVYTGSRAAEEMLKAIDDINARSRSFFNSLFWL